MKQNFSGKAIRLLSLGAGYFLQDLILIAKLVESGTRTLHITLVEPDENAEYPYQDFVFLMEKMRAAYGPELRLSWEKFKSITEIKAKNLFDVVYAIDYEDYEAFKIIQNGSCQVEHEILLELIIKVLHLRMLILLL